MRRQVARGCPKNLREQQRLDLFVVFKIRHVVAAPHHMTIGPHQDEAMFIECDGIGLRNALNCQRHSARIEDDVVLARALPLCHGHHRPRMEHQGQRYPEKPHRDFRSYHFHDHYLRE